MINLFDYSQANKKEIEKILKYLKKLTKDNPEIKGFNIYTEKNNRGDYGYNEIYKYQDNIFLIISMDGARQNVNYYTNPRYKLL